MEPHDSWQLNTANSLGRYGYDYTTITGNVHSANMKMSRQNTIHCVENIDITSINWFVKTSFEA